jgi:Xaa-Pro aminopeptidase
MAAPDPVVESKIEQVPGILGELGLDAWLLFARESATVHDPSFDLVVGSNVTWHSAFILTRKGDRAAIVGSLDRANVEAHGHYRDIVSYVAGIREDLRTVLARLDPHRIAIDFSTDDPSADGLTHGMYLALVDLLAGTPFSGRLESAGRLVAALRGRKTGVERERIRAACEETVAIFDRLTRRLRAGLTERQVAAMIVEEMRRVPGLALAWDPDHCPAVFTGPQSAGAHTGPTDRPIEPGHLMNVDFGVRKDDYVSDLQRTWYFLRPGEVRPPEAVSRGVATIIEAIRAGAREMRPGRPGVDIDEIVRSHIVSRGFPSYEHGTGHQVGRTVHDGGAGVLPAWERYGKTPFFPLEEGQCFTIEPRLPVEGHGVATVEEIVWVGPDRTEFLSRTQEELFVVGK